MGYPRHIGHSDDDWTELLDNIEKALEDYRTEYNTMSGTRTIISDLAFSVGQKAYLAGYAEAVREATEAALKGRKKNGRV